MLALYVEDIARPKKTPGVMVAIELGARRIIAIDRELRKRNHA